MLLAEREAKTGGGGGGRQAVGLQSQVLFCGIQLNDLLAQRFGLHVG